MSVRPAGLSLAVLGFLSGPPARAVLPDPAEQTLPGRILTLETLQEERLSKIPTDWDVYMQPGVVFDRNLNRLLINATSNSNVRLPDMAVYTAAGAALRPYWGVRWYPTLSYNFQRYDYQDHNDFSYYNNDFYGSLRYWFVRHWGVEASADASLYSDQDGSVAHNENVYAAMRWSRRPWKMRWGYGRHWERYRYSEPNNAEAHVLFLEASRKLRRKHTVFSSWYHRRSHARRGYFSYRSHYAELGAVSFWTRRWKTTLSATLLYKPYVSLDPRFGSLRQDRTWILTAKPSFAFYPQLRLVGIYTWTMNNSSVSVKDYVAQVYTLLLEARF